MLPKMLHTCGKDMEEHIVRCVSVHFRLDFQVVNGWPSYARAKPRRISGDKLQGFTGP